jgi:hypothetical protein
MKTSFGLFLSGGTLQAVFDCPNFPERKASILQHTLYPSGRSQRGCAVTEKTA